VTAQLPDPDPLLDAIASYVTAPPEFRDEAYATARLCLLDSLGCAILALRYPACTGLIGPVRPSFAVADGLRVPGTAFRLDPIQAAFSLGTMIRWLDFNDTWLAAEWGHPSDNLGGILPCAELASRDSVARGGAPLSVRDVLSAMIQAYEIQGVLALENSFNRLGLDHVILVRVATAAVAARLLGANRDQVRAAVSNAWIDGGALRTYRHAPNVGPRKSWAAGDATSRGVWHALMALRGEPGYPGALSAPTWGFTDVLLRGNALVLARPFGSYVIENVLFKISYPAEFHGQTAVEAAIRLHPVVRGRIEEVERVLIETQESAMRIIAKDGPLRNPADRDHCIQFMVAVGLVHGNLTADDYEDGPASDPRIERLRARTEVRENSRYSRDYLDPDKRSVANAVQVVFRDGTRTDRLEIEYPIGHRRRRVEGIPLLRDKLVRNLGASLSREAVAAISSLADEPSRMDACAVRDFLALFDATGPSC